MTLVDSCQNLYIFFFVMLRIQVTNIINFNNELMN